MNPSNIASQTLGPQDSRKAFFLANLRLSGLLYLTCLITSCGSQESNSRLATNFSTFSRQSFTASQPTLTQTDAPRVSILGDTNRDGKVDELDQTPGKSTWSWQEGMLIMPNIDDDDRDGKSDASDTVINGDGDLADLAPMLVRSTVAGTLEMDVGAAPLNLFYWQEGRWNFLVPGSHSKIAVDPDHPVEWRVESRQLVGERGWKGLATIQVQLRDETGNLIASDSLGARASSWLVLPNSARTQTLYIANGYYDNSSMVQQLSTLLRVLKVSFPPSYRAKSWQEMWMQDSLEIGYLEIPGSSMHAVLNGVRGHDSFGPSLLGPNIGVFQIGSFRDLGSSAPDSWVDWFGNLEVSHPTERYPLGRIYYGMNTNSGLHLQDPILNFLKAQEVQDPMWVDTSWLTIKHVDEIFNFIPGPDGRGTMLVVSPRAAAKVLGQNLDAPNAKIQGLVDKMLHGGSYEIAGTQKVEYPGVWKQLGWNPTRVVEMPILFSASVNAHGKWSDPVNSIYINGDMIIGSSGTPRSIQDHIAAQLSTKGIAHTRFIDDSAYNLRAGNIHCATNTRRVPLFSNYWQKMTP